MAAVLAAGEAELTPGVRSPERELAGGQQDAFALTLRAGQALAVDVVQRGIDVVVSVRGPKGDALLEVDSPNGTEGPEPVLVVAQEDGRHTLTVRALDPNARPGHYRIGKPEVRAATPRDRELFEALGLIGRAWALRGEMRQAAALPLAERALALRERTLGGDDLAVADVLTLLGYLYDEVGDYRRGVEAFERALAIRQRRLAADDPALSTNISDLGHLRLAAGDYDGAEKLLMQALAIRERASGSQVGALSGLQALYRERGDSARARQYQERRDDQRDSPSGRLALGQFALDAGRYGEAESLCEAGRAGSEKGTGFAVWSLASSLECLGLARFALGRAAEAEADLRRSLKIREDVAGPEHPFVAASLTALARVLATRDPAGARALLQRALAIRERSLSPNDLDIADTLSALGDLERAARHDAAAEAAYRRSLSIYDASAPRHPGREKTTHALETLRCGK
jgi:tetratricopeptide (TPR) repeat protein